MFNPQIAAMRSKTIQFTEPIPIAPNMMKGNVYSNKQTFYENPYTNGVEN